MARVGMTPSPTSIAQRLTKATHDLEHRLLWSLLLGGGALIAGLSGGPLFVGLVGAVMLLALMEWFLLTGAPTRWPLFSAVISLLLLLAAVALSSGPLLGIMLVLLALWGGLAVGLARWRWPLFGVAYATIVVCAFLHFRLDAEFGLAAMVFIAFTVWGTDVCAYFVGRFVGGIRLAPEISPGKTWSGAIGGAIGGAAIGVSGLMLVHPGTGLIHVVLALGLSSVSQLGDLGESWVKRRFDVKDASRLIPGHGGMLDRIDGLIAAMIAAYAIGLVRSAGEAPASGLIVW